MWAVLARILSGGVLGRALDLAESRIDAATDRDRIKADLIREHMRTRGDFMRSGGFWLMLIFAVPLAFWFAAVCVYSVFWCAGCAYPQDWSIAALPAPLDQWGAAMVIAIFGVVGVSRFK